MRLSAARLRFILIGLILAVGLLFSTWQLARSDDCPSPLFPGRTSHPGTEALSAVWSAGAGPNAHLRLRTAGLAGASLVGAAVEQVRAGNTASIWHSLGDDDPVYSLEVDVRLRYDDGRSALFHWSSWRYGLVLCPLVFGGDGPPGRIELVRIDRPSP